jgi:4-diphosphocytidyl-2-C-methyl-D-erythritol kinase
MKGPQPASRHAGLSLNAPAKINWFLGIAGKREDGYHNIISLMQCISLYDTLTFAHADSINMTTDLDIPVRDNLVHRAASLLKDYACYGKGADILLKKNVPVSAGLGGGSSDAAFTLLIGPVALVEGKGEKTRQVEIVSSVILLLVKPAISVSTAWAYADFDRMNSGKLTKRVVDIKLFCRAVMRKDFASLGNMLFNDFDEVVTARYPLVSEIKLRLIEEGAFFSAMSGSGPSVFGVFGSRESAEKAASRLEPHLCRVVETLI